MQGMTPSRMRLSIMPLNKMTFSRMTLKEKAHRALCAQGSVALFIMTFNIMRPNGKGNDTLQNDAQQNDAQQNDA
jgi:hypothetical protein